MTDITQLHKAVSAVMGDVHKLKKDEDNKHGNYKYVSVDSFKDLVRPLLAKNGLSLNITEAGFEVETLQGKNGPSVNARITYEFRLRHESGVEDIPERTTVMLPFTGAQTAGAAKSYALKEYLKGRFLVSTGDKDEIHGGADADSYAPQEYTAAPVKKSPPTYERSRIVRDKFEELQKGFRQIRDTGTMEDLDSYWDNNIKAIEGLPKDWLAELKELVADVDAALRAKVPA